MSKGRPPAPRTPQEKKAFSYAKDRRNDYGNSNKAPRRIIPLRKAAEIRASRHRANQALSVAVTLDEDKLAVVESTVRQEVGRIDRWEKGADTPLGEFIANQKAKRAEREGRRTAERNGDRAGLRRIILD